MSYPPHCAEGQNYTRPMMAQVWSPEKVGRGRAHEIAWVMLFPLSTLTHQEDGKIGDKKSPTSNTSPVGDLEILLIVCPLS